MEMNIGESKAVAKASVNALNNLLADQFVMLAKVWGFHWNVVDPNFASHHAFLEKLYREIMDNIDDVAECARCSNGRPMGSLKAYLAHTRIKEVKEDEPVLTACAMLAAVLTDYETVIREVRSDLDNLDAKDTPDKATIGFLEDFITRTEKSCWMIRAHLPLNN